MTLYNKTVNRRKDLGVTLSEDLSPEKYINKITRETLKLLKNIRVAFAFLDEEMMRKIVTTTLRRRLEYAMVMWSSYGIKHQKTGPHSKHSNKNDTGTSRAVI